MEPLPEAEPISPKVLRHFICPYVPSSLFDCGIARSGAKLATACPYKHLVEDTKFDDASKKHRELALYYRSPTPTPITPTYAGVDVDLLYERGFALLDPVVCLDYLEGRCYESTVVRPSGHLFCQAGLWHPTSAAVRALGKSTRPMTNSSMAVGVGSSLVAPSAASTVRVAVPIKDVPRLDLNNPSDGDNDGGQDASTTTTSSATDGVASQSSNCRATTVPTGSSPTLSQGTQTVHGTMSSSNGEPGYWEQLQRFGARHPVPYSIMAILLLVLICGLIYAIIVGMRH